MDDLDPDSCSSNSRLKSVTGRPAKIRPSARDGRHATRGVDDPRARRYLLSRFPYSIVYVVAVAGGITVAAVPHTKRKPGYWLRRV